MVPSYHLDVVPYQKKRTHSPVIHAEATFRFHHPVAVRFKDVDVGGHAHHSHALVYFEEARAAYWRTVIGGGHQEDIDYILAECEIRWRGRVLWPQELSVGVRVSRLGKKHFDMTYEVLGEDGAVLQTGRTTQVMYDYETSSVKAMSDEIRAAIEAFDGPF